MREFFSVGGATMHCGISVFPGLLSLLGSPAISNEPPFPKSHPTEGEGQGAGRAGVCAAEPQEGQRGQSR